MSPRSGQPMIAPDVVRLNDVSGPTFMSGQPTTAQQRPQQTDIQHRLYDYEPAGVRNGGWNLILRNVSARR